MGLVRTYDVQKQHIIARCWTSTDEVRVQAAHRMRENLVANVHHI